MWQAATGSTLLTSATIIASGCALWPALFSSGEGGYQPSGIARTAINVVLAGFGMACWLHASNPHARLHGPGTHHLVAASAAAAAQQAQQQAAAAAAANDNDDDGNDDDEDKEGREDDVARDPVLSQLTPYRAVRMCSCAYRPLAEEWDALVNMDGAFVLEQQQWQRGQQGQQDGCGLEERGSICPGCGRSSAASGGNSSSSTSSSSSASSTSSTSSSSCYFHPTVEVLPDVGPAHHHCHAASTDPALGPEAPSAAAAATAANAAAVLPAGHRVLVLTPSDHVLQLVARAQSSAGLPTCHESATAEAETEAAEAAPCAAVSAAQPARTEPSAWPDATASCSPPGVWHCADEWDRDPERSWAHATAPAAASPVPPAASNSAPHPPPLVQQPQRQPQTRQSPQPLPGLLTQPQHTMPQPQSQPAALSARPCPPPPPPPVTVVVVIRGTDPDVLSNVVADLQLVADNLLGGGGGGEGGGAKPYDVHDVNCVEDKQQQQQQQQRPQPGVGWAVAQVCWRMLRVVSNAVGALAALSTSRPAQQQQKQQQKLDTHGGSLPRLEAATAAAGAGVGAARGHVGVAPMRQAVLAEVVAAMHRQCDRLEAHGVVLRPAGDGAAATGPGHRARACGGSTSGGSTSGGSTSGGGGGVRLRVLLTGHSLGGYLAQAVALQLMAARRLAAASTTAANSCDSSATNPTGGNGGASGGVDAALLLALGLCERVEVEVVRCLAFDSPGLLPADLQLVARHRLVPAEMRRVLHAYMAHPNPINMLGARAVPAGAAGAAVAAPAELCGGVEERGDGGRGGRGGQSAEPPRRQLLMTMYHVVAPAKDTWTYLFRCTTAAVGRIVAYDAAATCLAASLMAAVFAAGAAAAWGVARAAAGVPALSGSTEGGGAAAAAETGSADLGGGGGGDASIARAGGHSSSTKAATASAAATAAWRGGYTHGGVASGGNGTAAGGVGPSAGVAGRATALALAAVGAARGCVRKAASAGLAALSAAAGVLQSQAQEQLQHHSTDSLALGLRGAPAGAAAVEAAAAIRAAAPTSTCAPVAPEGSPCGVCGRHGSKTGSCGSGGSINSFRNSGKGAAGARPAVVRMRSWPEWGMGVSGLRQAAVAAARVVAVPSPLCRGNIGFKCVFMSRQQHTCDAYAAEEGYVRQ